MQQPPIFLLQSPTTICVFTSYGGVHHINKILIRIGQKRNNRMIVGGLRNTDAILQSHLGALSCFRSGYSTLKLQELIRRILGAKMLSETEILGGLLNFRSSLFWEGIPSFQEGFPVFQELIQLLNFLVKWHLSHLYPVALNQSSIL